MSATNLPKSEYVNLIEDHWDGLDQHARRVLAQHAFEVSTSSGSPEVLLRNFHRPGYG